jgi:hypothetical protein
MSWEEMSVHKYKCPCKSSTYTITVLSDDWHRTKEQVVMDCPKCKKEYCQYDYSYPDSGMDCGSFVWVRRKELGAVKQMETKLHKAERDVINLAQKRYLSKWLTCFKDAKSKKEIWRRLTDSGKRYPSITAFYSHIKNKGIELYLSEEFYPENIPTILKKICIVDREISNELQSVKQTEADFGKAVKRLIKEGYK